MLHNFYVKILKVLFKLRKIKHQSFVLYAQEYNLAEFQIFHYQNIYEYLLKILLLKNEI